MILYQPRPLSTLNESLATDILYLTYCNFLLTGEILDQVIKAIIYSPIGSQIYTDENTTELHFDRRLSVLVVGEQLPLSIVKSRAPALAPCPQPKTDHHAFFICSSLVRVIPRRTNLSLAVFHLTNTMDATAMYFNGRNCLLPSQFISEGHLCMISYAWQKLYHMLSIRAPSALAAQQFGILCLMIPASHLQQQCRS